MSVDQQSSAENEKEDSSVLPIGEHIEEVAEADGKKVRHKGIYLLPNLFTTMALFCGYYAVIAGMQHRFENAAIAIFVAMIFDGLDGRVARLTNTQSAFGVQYDSLSDMVSFGVAPGLVMFNWALVNVGKFGWSAAFLYCACAALRLARFNTQVETADKRYFTGLASPAAAAVIAGAVWLGSGTQIEPGLAPILLTVLTAVTGLLMVTNLRYYSFKGLDFKGRVPLAYLLAVPLIIMVLAWHIELMVLSLAVIYALSGPVLHWKTRHSVQVDSK
ncbi:MAG: CDP-diacylglycerol--serine O-phosphatidyltransferase [Pseudomonadales bacterium]